MAKYRVVGQIFYRKGRRYHPGDTVDLPDTTKPPSDWVRINEKAAAEKAAPPPAPPLKGKGTDKTPI